jgi:hypothetical protein
VKRCGIVARINDDFDGTEIECKYEEFPQRLDDYLANREAYIFTDAMYDKIASDIFSWSGTYGFFQYPDGDFIVDIYKYDGVWKAWVRKCGSDDDDKYPDNWCRHILHDTLEKMREEQIEIDDTRRFTEMMLRTS